MILERFDLQARAILRLEHEALVAAVVALTMLLELCQIELEQGRVSEGPFAIGAPLGVHLKQTEIHAELDFFLSILADKFPHDDLAGLVIPLVQEV
jgi:hypothetical protein